MVVVVCGSHMFIGCFSVVMLWCFAYGRKCWFYMFLGCFGYGWRICWKSIFIGCLWVGSFVGYDIVCKWFGNSIGS